MILIFDKCQLHANLKAAVWKAYSFVANKINVDVFTKLLGMWAEFSCNLLWPAVCMAPAYHNSSKQKYQIWNKQPKRKK